MSEKENTAGSPSKVTEITTDVDFEHHTSHLPSSTLLVLYFHTPWAAPCTQMSTVLSALASSYPVTTPPAITFLSLNAEDLPDISEAYDVSAVPFLVLVRDGKVLQTVSGSDAAKVRDAVEKHAGKSGNTGAAGLPPAQVVNVPKDEPISNGASSGDKPKDLSGYAPTSKDPATAPEMSDPTNTSKEELHKRLSELVKAAPVMLFMKGSPSAPQCGFSRQTVSLLRDHGVRYGFFNILADDEVRQGLKEFADWPTFPQVWIDGELVGGLDILREEVGNDPEFLKKYAVKPKEGSAAPDAKGGPTAPEAQVTA
ncbi:MAG: monothiol glutaredoxin grx4 [Candelina submexicana]|nr:MAG: monothiol glutaredoxin grx4 [Candelina submexicana]